MRSRQAFVLKLLTGLVALLALLFVAAPSSRILVLFLVGRSEICSLRQGLEVPGQFRRQRQLQEQLARSARLLKEDGTLQLWSVGRSEFWVPKRSKENLPLFLAEQERGIYGAGPYGVKSGDIVLDCGAHIGMFVRTALGRGAKLVVAIEPSPENIECLRRNFAAEVATGRVIVYPKGVWDADTELDLSVDHRSSARDSVVWSPDERQARVRIPVTTIDRIVAELGLGRVDFIKMDIEGAERWALRGARGTLVRYWPRLAIAVEHMLDDVSVFPALVTGVAPGYGMTWGPCQERGLRIVPEVGFFVHAEPPLSGLTTRKPSAGLTPKQVGIRIIRVSKPR